MKETLGMWWFKSLAPVAIVILTGVCTWMFGTFDEFESDIAELREFKIQMIHNQESTREGLDILKDMTKGIAENSQDIAVLNAKVDTALKNNTAVMNSLLEELQRRQ